MRQSILATLTLIAVVGGLAACSGSPKTDSYTDHTGKTTLIESDREECVRSCNEQYSRCMESNAAQTNNGINGPSGMFGATADCRDALKDCLPTCKGL